MFTIYLAFPITGKSYDSVISYINSIRSKLGNFNILNPMTGKAYLRNEIEFKAHGYSNPVSTNHAIFERDQFMVKNCDIVLMNLLDATCASIGCIMELAWASLLGKHTVVIMGSDNVHRHAFVLEAADIIFETEDDAISYLNKFCEQVVE